MRYRFDAAEQLQRHVYLHNGGPGFLYLGDRDLPFATGSRVVLEIFLAKSDHRSLFHGSVRSRERDGLWVELPMARSALAWMRAPNPVRRAARRVAADLFAEVRVAGQPAFLCRVADISTAGLRLASGSLNGLLVGDEVNLQLLPPEPGLPAAELLAHIAWIGQRQAGLEMVRSTDALGTLVSAIESRWDHADQLAHATSCACETTGAVPEPWPYWLPR